MIAIVTKHEIPSRVKTIGPYSQLGAAPYLSQFRQPVYSGMVTMAHALSIVVAGASIAAVASNPAYAKNILLSLVRATGYGQPGGLWRIAAILLALANLKNLPFVWHASHPSPDLSCPPSRNRS